MCLKAAGLEQYSFAHFSVAHILLKANDAAAVAFDNVNGTSKNTGLPGCKPTAASMAPSSSTIVFLPNTTVVTKKKGRRKI